MSFPGEHRARVEKIAVALGERLGRDKVLYDRWYAAEFARPNLDVYLVNLYHEQSELLVVFLCGSYVAKEWCGLEWRASRDLLKQRQDDRLMFLRLDDADVPGLYSIDGYLDIRSLPDEQVAAEIFKRVPQLVVAPANHRAFTAKLPEVNSLLIGRDSELAFLDSAWTDPNVNIVQIIAPGGTGKTALMDKWFRGHVKDATIFGWSFYSQGTSENRQTSSDPFFADILPFFKINVPTRASVWARAEALAAHLRKERVLLILDGLEPLQESTGDIRDTPLKALLKELRTDNLGMVLCTTRVRIKELPDDEHTRSRDLDNLSPHDGRLYLRALGVEGTDDELQKASEEFGNHALALTLLGTYLVDFHRGDIRHRADIHDLMVDETESGAHARRVMASYARMFEGKPELDILRALGYFDRPAEPAAIRLVMPKIDDIKYQAALVRLRKARLILGDDSGKPLDAHPLVREYFGWVMRTTAEVEFKAGHSRLYDYYSRQAPPLPDTREAMTPLFYAVYHGCQAGRHQEALSSVYYERILRRDESYLIRKICDRGTNLSLLTNFFDIPWSRLVPGLSEADQSWGISMAASTLRSLGRLADAVVPTQTGAATALRLEDWNNAARYYANLSELYLSLSNLVDARVAASDAVVYANRSGDAFLRASTRSQLATILHQTGDHLQAEHLFKEAERCEGSPLASMRGYLYCDFLLDRHDNADVIGRAIRSLGLLRTPLDNGLDHLSLGRACPPGSQESCEHLNQALEFLRRAGDLTYLPLALLARATDHDLTEAYTIASRCGMRLYLADYHLIQARRLQSRDHLEKAETLINETGYHRRDAELAKLKAELA